MTTTDPRLPTNGRLAYPQALLWIGLRDIRAIDREMTRHLGWAKLSAETVARHVDEFLQTAPGVIDYGPAGSLKTALSEGIVKAFGALNDERKEIPKDEWRILKIAGRSGEVFGGAHGEVRGHSGRRIKWDTLSFEASSLVEAFPLIGHLEVEAAEVSKQQAAHSTTSMRSRRDMPQLQEACCSPDVLSLAFSSLGSDKPTLGKLAIAVAAILNTRGHDTTSGSIETTWRKSQTNDIAALTALAGIA